VSVDTSKSTCAQYGRNKVALRTTCIKHVRFKIIITIRSECLYVGYLYSTTAKT